MASDFDDRWRSRGRDRAAKRAGSKVKGVQKDGGLLPSLSDSALRRFSTAAASVGEPTSPTSSAGAPRPIASKSATPRVVWQQGLGTSASAPALRTAKDRGGAFESLFDEARRRVHNKQVKERIEGNQKGSTPKACSDEAKRRKRLERLLLAEGGEMPSEVGPLRRVSGGGGGSVLGACEPRKPSRESTADGPQPPRALRSPEKRPSRRPGQLPPVAEISRLTAQISAELSSLATGTSISSTSTAAPTTDELSPQAAAAVEPAEPPSPEVQPRRPSPPIVVQLGAPGKPVSQAELDALRARLAGGAAPAASPPQATPSFEPEPSEDEGAGSDELGEAVGEAFRPSGGGPPRGEIEAGAKTMQRFEASRRSMAVAVDLQVGGELPTPGSTASVFARETSGVSGARETQGWRQLALSAVPLAEEKDKELAEQKATRELDAEPSPQSKKRLVERRVSVIQNNGMLDLDSKWERVKATCLHGDPLQPDDVEVIKLAFRRFKAATDSEVHTKDLPELIAYLGFIVARPDDVSDVAKQVTPYSTLDFEEVVSFVERFSRHECRMLQDLFTKSDDDSSGKLDVEELRHALIRVGFIPTKAMVNEALQAVDDGDGELEFEEFMHLLTVYRHNQGFTRSQVAQMWQVFLRFAMDLPHVAPSKVLLKSALQPALCHTFGEQVEKSASAVSMRLLGQGNKVPRSSPRTTGDRTLDYTRDDVLEFPELLVCARRVKELELQRLTVEFRHYDMNGSGSISTQELENMLTSLGFEPLEAPVLEMLKEVSDVEDYDSADLDMYQFFDFMELFWEREGFSKSEVTDVEGLFEKFDVDDGGTIGTSELNEVLRSVGHRVSNSELAGLIAENDVNRSGYLDPFEFLRLMRQHRDQEIRRLRGVFRQFLGDGQRRLKDVIPANNAHAALAMALGETPPKPVIELCDQKLKNVADSMKAPRRSPRLSSGPFGARRPSAAEALAERRPSKVGCIGISFSDFFELSDYGRSLRVMAAPSNGGFSDAELKHFRGRFKKYDTDADGTLDHMEVRRLLVDLQVGWRTRQDQLDALADFEQAREAARKAGMPSVGGPKELQLGFWDFVQLVRLLLNRREKELEEQIDRTAEELHFSWAEVKQFRDIFDQWSMREAASLAAVADASPASPSRAPEAAATIASPGGKGLSTATFMGLFRSLGVAASHRQMAQLEELVREHPDRNSDGKLGFVGFLKMMRWLLDTDFAGINAAAEKRVSVLTQDFLARHA